jgi:glycosyltransferase involved in cell wall biosynthesis/capsular polysaccharide biosynthesis protein
MTDPGAGLSILHVIVRAGETNSQYNEHCLPMLGDRSITVCSLFPADVVPPPTLRLFEGDGTVRGCFRALRRALAFAEYDVVHVHAAASGMVTLATYGWTRRARRDLVLTVHNSWKSFRLRNRIFLRLLVAFFPLVVVCGQAARDSMPHRLLRRRGHKITVVPNGVDVDRVDTVLTDFEPVDRVGEGRTVVSVGRLIRIKDPVTLVESFAAAAGDDDGLVMVGEGPLREDIDDLTADLQLGNRVHLTGLVPRDEVYRLNRSSDVFVTTSRGEGLPVAMLEAMACGLPVVASDIPPHREIASRVTGLPLVPVGDREGFARALRRMLAMSDAERERVGARLRQCVAEQFSVTAMNHRYGQLYAGVAAGGAHRRQLRPAEAVPTEAEPLAAKLRRHAVLLAVLSVLGGVGGFVFANLQAPVYKAETTLMVGTAAAVASEDELKLSSALAVAYADLARREPVLGPVAEAGFAESWRELQPDVHVQTGAKNPQLLQISVYSGDPRDATQLAGAVSDQLVRVAASGAASPQLRFVREQVDGLQRAVRSTSRELEATLVSLDSASGDEREVLQATADRLRRDLTELQRGYAELEQLDHAGVGLLTTVDSPWVTRSPLRPTPIGLAAAGAALGLTLAAGWVHVVDPGRPATPLPAPGTTASPVWNAAPNKKRGTRP